MPNFFHPSVSSLVNQENVPEFLQNSLNSILSKLFYKSYLVEKSKFGDYSFHRITLVLNKEIGLNLFGGEDGFEILFNPGATNTTELPISISFNLPVLRYANRDRINQISSPSDFFNLISEILEITNTGLIYECVVQFYDLSFEQFIADFNSNPNFQEIPELYQSLQGNPNDSAIKLAYIMDSNEVDIVSYIFGEVISVTNSIEDTFDNLLHYFSQILGSVEREDLFALLIPKLSVSINSLDLALAVPRTYLKPLDENDDVITEESEKVRLTYSFGSLNYHTQKGIEFKGANVVNLPKCQIGDTALLITILDLKFDFREDKNIPEADDDGRPNNFKGVYVKEASVEFPCDWVGDGNAAAIITKNLLIGTEGGVSGTIGFNAGDARPNEEWISFEIQSLDDIEFDSITNKMTANGFKKISSGNTEEEIELTEPASKQFNLQTEGFHIRDSEDNIFFIDNAGTVTEEEFTQNPLGFDIGLGRIELNTFSLTLHKNKIVSSSVTGILEIPTHEGPIAIAVLFGDGLEVCLSSQAGVELTPIDIPSIKVGLLLTKLGMKKVDNLYDFTVKGVISPDISVPKVKDILPNKIKINDITIKTGDRENTYDLEMAWPGGAKIGGNTEAGFSGYIPWNQASEDPKISLDGIKLSIENVADANGLEFSAEFQKLILKLSILEGRFDGMGMGMIVTKPEDIAEANVGGLKIDLSFVKPKGIGITMGSPGKKVYVSGYLYIDEERGRFAGYLSIKLNLKKKLALDAIGVYTTKYPDGTEGNSFLGLITMELPKPIPLALGFSLAKVGGMVGINRDLDGTAMVQGVRNGSLQNMFFPEINLNTFDNILVALESFFPIEKGRHTFAIVFGLKYSAALTLDLALMISIPSPLVFGIAGILRIERGKKLNLNAAFLILVDLGKKLISIDASIFDSTIGKIRVEGDLAARIGWGDNRQFLISIGGFHPNYSTDEFVLPELKRVRLIIKDEERLKLMGAAYVAVTSNAVMFGARVDLLYIHKNGKLKVEAYAGLDILFVFNPFRFEVDIYIGAAIFWKEKPIFSISLGLYLKGPGKWHAKGHAELVILKLKLKAKFDKQFGDEDNEAIETINPWAYLRDELEKDENWYSSSPMDESVTRRELPETETEIVVSTDGTVRVDQLAVPLDITLEKIGENKVTNFSKFNISGATLKADVANGSNQDLPVNVIPKEDYFAPANYKKLSDKEKLEGKSYELMKSGVDISAAESWVVSSHQIAPPIGYDHVYSYDTDNEPPRNMVYQKGSNVNRPNSGDYGKTTKFRKSARRFKNKKVRITKPIYDIVDQSSGGTVIYSSKSKTAVKERIATQIQDGSNSSSIHTVRTVAARSTVTE